MGQQKHPVHISCKKYRKRKAQINIQTHYYLFSIHLPSFFGNEDL